MKLFEGSDVSDEEEISKIEINKEFARRYEHNKRREDLQKLDELKKKGVISDSSESEDGSSSDEVGIYELTNSKKDLEFLNALIKVKNHDPELKNNDAKLFESDKEDNQIEGDGEKRNKKKSSMYLKDVTARHLIEDGPEFEEGEEEKKEEKRVKSYSEEQEELRREFLNAAEAAWDGDDGGGELLKEKKRKGTVDEEDANDDLGEVEKKLDEFFGKDDKLDNNEKFLKEYFRNKMWVGDEDNSGVEAVDEEEVLGLSVDEEEVEKQDDYERGYNFRHEENAGDRVLGHSRFVEGSVRKKMNARKVQRKRKEERMSQAEFDRKEELKHLKNLKKKEMKEKLRKIKDTAGIGENGFCTLGVGDLEEEFDPEEYDSKMKEAFNDDYYGADDVDPEFGTDGDEEKPDFDKEDDLLGFPKGWDDISSSGNGFLAFRERKLKRSAENGGPKERIEDLVNEEVEEKKKRKMSEMEKQVIKELEEYYKLDYEDTIGDLKTRFKYRGVGAKKFGLSTEEILMLDDKELNQYVSLKKIAPYREKDWKVPINMRYSQKQRNTKILQGVSNNQKTGKKFKLEDKKSKEVAVPTEYEKAQVEKTNGDVSNLSRNSRRRRGQAELKLSHSRLLAYGKIPSKSKKKK